MSGAKRNLFLPELEALKMKTPEKPAPFQFNLWSTKEDFKWEDYKVAREYVHSLGLKNKAEWEGYVRGRNLRDAKIPGEPDNVYRNRGWVDWNDWLGIREPETLSEPPQSSLFDNAK